MYIILYLHSDLLDDLGGEPAVVSGAGVAGTLGLPVGQDANVLARMPHRLKRHIAFCRVNIA